MATKLWQKKIKTAYAKADTVERRNLPTDWTTAEIERHMAYISWQRHHNKEPHRRK